MWAVDTYKANHSNQNIIEADITALEDEYFAPYKGKIDIVMGGPPCQGFSIAASNRRKKDDSRNSLYRHFLRVVSIVEPAVVLIENVKEIVGYKLPDGTKIVEDIKKFFDKAGYGYDYGILNCRFYGIPQDRKRFFFVAVRRDVLDGEIHLETLMERYKLPELPFNDAVSDLPIVRARQFPEDTVLDYDQPSHNQFQEIMRIGSNCIYNHIPMQHTEKTVQKFEFLLSKNGEDLPEELKQILRSHTDVISDASYSQNHRIIDGHKVSPTITASFYSSFIHPSQPRNLTVREAARIQTFPDSFRFYGKKTTLSKKLLAKKGLRRTSLDQFNQVGNAVPPLMAKHLAEICIQLLSKGKNA
ncbi:MAG: DNA cytosine methyltransferase [Blautia obeum]